MSNAKPFRLFRLPVISWAMYDFANTIFSLAVITTYLNEWITEPTSKHGLAGPDWYVTTMQLIVAVGLVITMPALGAIADNFGRRKPFVIFFSTICIAATVLLGLVSGTMPALVVAGLAIFAYQSAIAHYDPLLGTVAPPEAHGRVSGMGVGLGYVGSLLGFLILSKIVQSNDSDPQTAFIPTAIMFLVFALPLFLFVRERGNTARDKLGVVVKKANQQLLQTVRHLREPEQRHVARFLIGRFLYADALLTVILWLKVYLNRSGGFTKSEQDLVMGISIASAAIGSFIAGSLVERLGPRKVLMGILTMFASTIFIVGITGSSTILWAAGPLVGIGLGGVWTSDRVFMMRLTHPESRGEYFGLYNVVGKLSSGIGPVVVWSGTGLLFHSMLDWSKFDANRVALVVLGVVAIVGMMIIRPLSDESVTDETVEVVA